MTNKRLHQLAYDQLLELWGKEHDFLEKDPENKIAQVREKRLWEELQELHELCLADESEN